jgi:hypothetical protein
MKLPYPFAAVVMAAPKAIPDGSCAEIYPRKGGNVRAQASVGQIAGVTSC